MERAESILREIGSEFWDIPTGTRPCSIFPAGTRWYLSGRTALRAIVSSLRGARRAALPDWCCDSMLRPFADAGIEIIFYPALARYREGFNPPDCDVLLVMDYFGFSSADCGSHPCVIRDVTHSLLSGPKADARWYFGSLRKWCGVRTGGFAWSGEDLPNPGETDLNYLALRRQAMEEKAAYLEGRSARKDYLEVFARAEALLDRNACLKGADPEDVSMAKLLDVERVRSSRRENAAVLMEAFSDWLVFPQLLAGDCPLFVPILVPQGKRDRLRQFLIENRVYCPVHWPLSHLHRVSEESLHLYENSISLVCDQRYGPADMERIVHTIRSFWKG